MKRQWDAGITGFHFPSFLASIVSLTAFSSPATAAVAAEFAVAVVAAVHPRASHLPVDTNTVAEPYQYMALK